MKNFFLTMAAGLTAVALLGCQPNASDKAADASSADIADAAASVETPTVATLVASPAPATSADAAPADACGESIVFTEGTDTTTATGEVSGYDTCTFRLTGKAGQQLHATIEGSTFLTALLFAPTSQDTAIAGPSDTLDAALPADGEHEIRIGQVRAEARRITSPKTFKLNVQLR